MLDSLVSRDELTIYDWLGSFTEVFVRGAFKKTIADRGLLFSAPKE